MVVLRDTFMILKAKEKEKEINQIILSNTGRLFRNDLRKCGLRDHMVWVAESIVYH